MGPTTIPSSKIHKTVNQSNNTAYWIFDVDAKVPFRVNAPHFKARTGGMNDPVLGMSPTRYQDMSAQMVYLQDTVMSLVEYFIEGATLEIAPETTNLVYDRIYNHMNAHMLAMQSSKSYNIEDTFNVFEDLVDFACAVYPTVLAYKDSNVKTTVPDDPFASMMYARPNFMTMFNKTQSTGMVTTSDTIQPQIKVSPLVNMLERMRVYYNGGMGWS